MTYYDNIDLIFIQEEKQKAYRKEKRKEKKRKHEETDVGGMDPAMAELMGFSGFGGSKKT